MALIELQDIRKHYKMGDETVKALDGITLNIEIGSYSAVLGPSGSGKSTLMHLLGFMDFPTSGKMLFDGDDVSRLSAAKRAWYRANRLGFVFQTFNLLPRLSILENVRLPLDYARSDRKKDDLAKEALARVDMTHRISHRPGQLSGGERQRVAIARALVNNPKLILADEPTGNLDTKNVERVMELFDALVDEGQTLILVTHDLEVAQHARSIILVRDGHLVGGEEDGPEDRFPHAGKEQQ
ncbi:ABC transporter ATP-binding protein [Cerasicoccus maritimus]|uniref:ABC transporter ATP-binding protein n=1 Tax=Cerasicoccus maritimus TaxID=490089 RepID=UPI002852C354|nr:ABC transporter ATP-binding protein [Cerasicoccus maritimus]